MKTPSFSKIIVTVCALFIFGGAFATASRAATFVVTNTGDNGGMNPAPNAGTGTLRQAIVDANANSGADIITFTVTGTIVLQSALPGLAEDVTISGPGANVLAVNGNGANRVFSVLASSSSVSISGLTITNGNAGFGVGGGINNDSASLTVSNCTISGSTAIRGGGIFNGTGQLTVIGSTLTANSGVDGGAMGNVGVTIVNSSTFNGNFASDEGGGIRNDGQLTVDNSTFSGNSVNFAGGAIENFSDNTLIVTNSTITGNRADADGNGSGTGGGIHSAAQGTETLKNTIVAGNFRGTGTTADDISGFTIDSASYNLIGDSSTSGGISNGTNGNIVGVDPKLGPLAYYGGPSATHILKTGSPAIDAGDPNFAPPPSSDQRGVGFPRVVNGRIDIGAFERQASDIDPTLVVTTTADTNANNTCSSSSPCSLRDAITAANASAPDDVIYFAVTGTITLKANGALPSLNSNMRILGPGANTLTVKRDPTASAFRIFTINSGKTVTLSGLTIANGSVAGSFPNFNGGGILNDHATLTVSNCTVSGNSATNAAGGILNLGALSGSAVLTVNNSTISGNSAAQNSGGILNEGFSGSASLTINNSTVSGNIGNGVGGGINNDGDTAGNATLIIHNSTISGNSATTGGGIYNQNGSGGTATVTIGGTILKTGASGTNISSPPGSVTSLGYNLSSDNETAFLNQTGDQNSTDPMLGPLQDNGGATFTHAPSPGSSAIDKGKNFTSFTTDQRGPGFSRIIGTAAVAGGDGSDIGAFEVQAPPNTPPTITAATGVTRQQGAASSNSQIATVHDNEDPPTALTVTVNGGTSATVNGVTVSNIAVANSGNVTADVVASCSASNASFTLRVTDTGGLFAEAMLTVNVTPNNPPVITTPGTINAIAQKKHVNDQKRGAFVSFNVSAVDPEDGPVTATASLPSGSFFPLGHTTVTVMATDHCGNTATAFFSVDVAKKKKKRHRH